MTYRLIKKVIFTGREEVIAEALDIESLRSQWAAYQLRWGGYWDEEVYHLEPETRGVIATSEISWIFMETYNEGSDS